MNIFNLLVAFLLDLWIGDPVGIPHPVVLIGKLITKLENIFYKEYKSNSYKLVTGAILVILVLFITYLSSWFLISIFTLIHPWLGWIINIWLISTTIAVKGLRDAGNKIKTLLTQNNINEARKEVGFIVGRDTYNLTENEIIRATVETIAENIVDAIISPLLFAFLGGAPLAMTYRAVNTLDSMLGYRNEKYLYFGRVAARLDDFFNYFPARLTGFSIVLICILLPEYSVKNSLKILKRDSRKHPSPNSGFSESAVSGALQVRLGGLNYYQGVPSQRPFIGDEVFPLTVETIGKASKIMLFTSAYWVLVLTFFKYVISVR